MSVGPTGALARGRACSLCGVWQDRPEVPHLCLPSHHGVSEADLERIAQRVAQILFDRIQPETALD